MKLYPPKQDLKRAPTSPGELLREDVLPSLGRSKAEIARLLGISRQSLYDILDEKQPVTPQMALRLGKLLGNGPELWINMQRARDLWEARQSIDIDAIPTLKQASRQKKTPPGLGRRFESVQRFVAQA